MNQFDWETCFMKYKRMLLVELTETLNVNSSISQRRRVRRSWQSGFCPGPSCPRPKHVIKAWFYHYSDIRLSELRSRKLHFKSRWCTEGARSELSWTSAVLWIRTRTTSHVCLWWTSKIKVTSTDHNYLLLWNTFVWASKCIEIQSKALF